MFKKTHTKKNKFKKQIKKNMQSKTVIPIIFDGKLWSCKRAYGYESLERTPIWEYPKIGYEIMTSVDVDLSLSNIQSRLVLSRT
jgi:hypothetical protein